MIRQFVAVACAMLGLAMPTPGQSADLPAPLVEPIAVADPDWEVAIAAYVWGTGLTGTIGVGSLPPVKTNMTFSNVLQDLDFAAFASGEVAYRRWVAATDLQYVKLSAEQNTPAGLLSTKAKLRTETVSWLFTGGYRAIDQDRYKLDMLAGGRLWSVSNRVSVSGGLLGPRARGMTETWVDPVIGMKGRMGLNAQFSLLGWGFIGGFGAGSDFTWDTLGALEWSPKKNVSVVVGYRAQAVDYSTSGFSYDVIQQGPLIGGVIRF